MELLARLKKKIVDLAQEDSEGLLRLLDEDRERAGENYEALRSRLLNFSNGAAPS